MPQNDPYAKIATPIDPYAAIATPINSPTPAQSQGMLSQLADFGRGVTKGVANTVSNVDDLVSSIPGIGKALTTPLIGGQSSQQARSQLHSYAQPTNTAQSLGRAAEQVGEFFLPGVDGEALASHALPYMGAAGKAAAPLAKMGAAALTTGAVNKAQGGSFGAGAALGAGGSGAGLLLKAAAPALAETALGVRAPDRAFNRTPGQAILQETTGVRPGDIAAQANTKVSDLTGQLNTMADQSTASLPLQPARDVAKSGLGTAVAQNNEADTRKALAILDQLKSKPISPGGQGRVPLPNDVSPRVALDLKRGIGALKNSWNPASPSSLNEGTIGRLYNTLDDQLDTALPGSQALNQRISTLIPVGARAGATDLNAGVLQRVIGRFARPTGALAGGGFGAYEGEKTGGLPGAIAGGLVGVAAPEVLSSPTNLMRGARVLNSPGLQKLVIPGVRSIGLQATRSSSQ